MRNKYYLIILLFVILFFCSLFFIFSYAITKFNIDSLYIEQTNNIIYFKNTKRGLNFSEVTISISKSRKSNYKTDYIYTWDETLFYKVNHDTLLVLCKVKASPPTHFNNNLIVIQREYTNQEYYDLLKNHKLLGFNKFPK
jgi:hypothetical protein